MQRRKVDFPDPDGPMMHTTSLGSATRLMPLRNFVVPERLVYVDSFDNQIRHSGSFASSEISVDI
jgi:hypothetical protein